MLTYGPPFYQPQGQTPSPPGVMDLNSLLGIQIGHDTTGMFALSLDGRLAVQTPAGRYVVKEGDRLSDVTFFLLPGLDPCVFRIPVSSVDEGDLIATPGSPSSFLFVIGKPETHHVTGVDPFTGLTVDYSPTENLLGVDLFVKVVSLFDLLFLGDDEKST